MYYETTNTETLLEQTFTTTTVDNINFWATNTSFINFVKGDTVTINYKGTKYTQEVKELNTVLYVGNLALGSLSPATNEPFLIANIYYPDGLSKLTPGITVATSETQTDANIKIYKSVQDIHTIEPKYIKDMYYSTEAFSPLIDFKVISGDINAIGSTMVVQYNGKEYTETVKDAAEEGSSEHIPYIGFKMGGTATPTEEQPFCYGINIMFNNNAKELYCAAPKTVSENEVITYNGESKTVKRLTIEDASILYVGNLHLLSTDFADTGEQYLTLFDYVSLITEGKLDLLVSIVPQDGILCGVKSENISYINPKYIKDMYYEETGDTILQIVNGTYTGEGGTGISYIMFPVTALLIADKPATIKTSQGLEETQVVKSLTVSDTVTPYIGNFGLLSSSFPDTGETYLFYAGKDADNGQLLGMFVQTTPFTDMKIEVSQFGIGETIVKMPLKYLPDEAATKSDVAKAIAEAITTTLNTDV